MSIVSFPVMEILRPFYTKGVEVVWENRNDLLLFWKTKLGKYKNKDIRFSMSGLYKIQIPDTDKFLLVLNRRIENQLQPVGGVFKRYGDDSLFNKWRYKPDSCRNGLGIDKQSSLDLRFSVSGKNVRQVLSWYEKERERETEPRREFKEEVLDTGILDPNIFHHFDQKKIRRYSKNLVWSAFFSCYEILIYDIFELVPNKEQKEALKTLSNQGTDLSKGYAIVSFDDIDQLRLMDGDKQIARIGQHTKLIINKDF